jgi:hypothetical protein
MHICAALPAAPSRARGCQRITTVRSSLVCPGSHPTLQHSRLPSRFPRSASPSQRPWLPGHARVDTRGKVSLVGRPRAPALPIFLSRMQARFAEVPSTLLRTQLTAQCAGPPRAAACRRDTHAKTPSGPESQLHAHATPRLNGLGDASRMALPRSPPAARGPSSPAAPSPHTDPHRAHAPPARLVRTVLSPLSPPGRRRRGRCPRAAPAPAAPPPPPAARTWRTAPSPRSAARWAPGQLGSGYDAVLE